jgi:hypothetical protein
MSARGGPVIYEVRLEAEREIAGELDAWLPGHVAEMLRLPGFMSARIFADSPLPDPPDGRVRRTVHYELQSLDALTGYLRDHAARMREAGRARFGDRMRATRSVLEPSAAAGERAARVCSNCRAPLTGQYCAVCGQRDRSRMISLWELVKEMVGEIFDADSRVWRTLVPLLFRPGRLTSEYLRGRRMAFTPPLRLYLVSSLLFFVIATYGGVDDTEFRFDGGPDEAEVNPDPNPDPDADPEAAPAPAVVGPPAPRRAGSGGWIIEEDGHCMVGDFETGNAFIDGPFRERVRRACERIVSDRGQSFVQHLVDNIPQMLFFFLPFVALVMKPLYFGSRRYYVEHLLFFVHYHSFAFIVLTLTLVSSRLAEAWPAYSLANGILIAVVSVYIPYYLFRALRVVYGQGRFVTLLKYIVLFFTYVFGLSLVFLVGAIVTALTV